MFYTMNECCILLIVYFTENKLVHWMFELFIISCTTLNVNERNPQKRATCSHQLNIHWLKQSIHAICNCHNLNKISPFISLSVCFCCLLKDLTESHLKHLLVTSSWPFHFIVLPMKMCVSYRSRYNTLT